MPSQTAFLGIAFIQVRSGQLDDAAATLDQLAKLQPEPSAAAVAVRSVIERRRGHIPEADALEQKARTRDSDATAWAIEQATKPAVH
jgi:predicted Zn-dependent protease